MKKNRLATLDGLRGVAILLVILNHIPLKIWYESINTNYHLFLDVLLVNGKVGVSILFLLTGFLMAWLYPKPKSKITFWSRRYARLFPAFLVMVTSLTIIKINGNLSIIKQILTVLTVGILARIIWFLGLKINKKIPIGKILTYFWISFQIIVALWYVFYLLKIPSPIFYQTWDKNLQWIVTGIVNATLTLPFGNYIGQLDGVYWSLITETFFYILYPVLFVPFFLYINKKKSIKWKTFLLLFSFLFCYSLNFISQRILALQMMFPSLIIYFVVGVTIGSNLKWWQKKFLMLPKILLKPASLILVLLITLSGALSYPILNENLDQLVPFFLTIPMGILLIAATLENKSLLKFVENKFLIFLGKYSYSLYLTHSLIISLALKIVQPDCVKSGFILVFIVMIGSIILAWCLYHLIEAPYYNLPKISINLEKNEKIEVIKNKFKKTVAGFSLVIFLILILAFKTPFSFFTYSFPNKIDHNLTGLLKENLLLTADKPLRYEFFGKQNYLGMITTNIKSIKNIDKQDSYLEIKLMDYENKVISKSNFDINNMVENNFYPFGFPIQSDSKNKKYIIEYSIEPKNSLDKIEISEKENQFISVYFLNKKNLIKNPKLLSWWLVNKVREPFSNLLFWWYLLLITPLVLTLLMKLFKNKKECIKIK